MSFFFQVFSYRENFLNAVYLVCIGIVGTVEYRKPEWVTHMEDMQAKLRGNSTISIDSLDEHDSCRGGLTSSSNWESVADLSESVFASAEGSFYLLPAIEEQSEEASSESSRSVGRSRSLHNVTAGLEQLDVRRRTFPRTKGEARHGDLGYPLEPRELDPEAFDQLHTADSSEELQEFLLLESQCMSQETGLAAAFLSSGRY